MKLTTLALSLLLLSQISIANEGYECTQKNVTTESDLNSLPKVVVMKADKDSSYSSGSFTLYSMYTRDAVREYLEYGLIGAPSDSNEYYRTGSESLCISYLKNQKLNARYSCFEDYTAPQREYYIETTLGAYADLDAESSNFEMALYKTARKLYPEIPDTLELQEELNLTPGKQRDDNLMALYDCKKTQVFRKD